MPCADPGITDNPQVDVVNHRMALAVCEGKRSAAAVSYENVRQTFGLGMGISGVEK